MLASQRLYSIHATITFFILFIAHSAQTIECTNIPTHSLKPQECYCIASTCYYRLKDPSRLSAQALSEEAEQIATGRQHFGYDIRNPKSPDMIRWSEKVQYDGHFLKVTVSDKDELQRILDIIAAQDVFINSQEREPIKVTVAAYQLTAEQLKNLGFGVRGVFLEKGLKDPNFSNIAEGLSVDLSAGLTGFFGGLSNLFRLSIDYSNDSNNHITGDRNPRRMFVGDYFEIGDITKTNTFSESSSTPVPEDFGLRLGGRIYQDQDDPNKFRLDGIWGHYKSYDPNKNVDQSFTTGDEGITIQRVTGVTQVNIPNLDQHVLYHGLPTIIFQREVTVRLKTKERGFFSGSQERFVDAKIVIFMSVVRAELEDPNPDEKIYNAYSGLAKYPEDESIKDMPEAMSLDLLE